MLPQHMLPGFTDNEQGDPLTEGGREIKSPDGHTSRSIFCEKTIRLTACITHSIICFKLTFVLFATAYQQPSLSTSIGT